ncbi:uncharacterized protein [Temnothorax nylanderi]|uniref:uncharacterized protein n=1 Tax=Temnothorax nylanderi TaxID=102681 RepID=UPI003A85524F
MPKIATKYYRRAKASTDSSINLVESAQAFAQSLNNNDFIRNDMSINEQLNCTDLDYNNIELDNNVLESLESDSNTSNNNNFINEDYNNIELDNNVLESLESDSNTSNNNNFINEKTLNNESIQPQLVTWALKNKITHVAINELLAILKPKHDELPLDARVLMKTPRKNTLKIVEPGHYYHFGLNNCIQKLSSFVTLKNLQQIEVYINIDGLPLFKSSNQQLWPILCSLVENHNKVGVVGIYCGERKPDDANVFLKDFIAEVIDLLTHGIIINREHERFNYPFKIKGFICDTPAKAFIKFTKGHTGYYSCRKCVIE